VFLDCRRKKRAEGAPAQHAYNSHPGDVSNRETLGISMYSRHVGSGSRRTLSQEKEKEKEKCMAKDATGVSACYV
jgi:hypothetical protein